MVSFLEGLARRQPRPARRRTNPPRLRVGPPPRRGRQAHGLAVHGGRQLGAHAHLDRGRGAGRVGERERAEQGEEEHQTRVQVGRGAGRGPRLEVEDDSLEEEGAGKLEAGLEKGEKEGLAAPPRPPPSTLFHPIFTYLHQLQHERHGGKPGVELEQGRGQRPRRLGGPHLCAPRKRRLKRGPRRVRRQDGGEEGQVFDRQRLAPALQGGEKGRGGEESARGGRAPRPTHSPPQPRIPLLPAPAPDQTSRA